MKKWIALVVTLVFLISAYLVTGPKRNLASSSSESLKMEYVQIKSDMIQLLQWQDMGSDWKFRIESSDPEFCKKWTEARLVLMADGMGVSGEAPGAFAKIQCQAGAFDFSWPKKMAEWSTEIEKTGDYIEIPERFFISSIEIEGSMGQMKISNYEIVSLRNITFEAVVEP